MDQDVALLARIVDNTPLGIIILTPGRTIRYVNTCAARIFNGTALTLVGSSMDRLIVDREGEPTWHELWSSIVEGKSREAKIVLSQQDGGEVTCILNAFSLGDAAGQNEAVALVFRDTTGDLKIAEQIEKKNIELAKMNAELIRSNVELKRLSEMKSNFLSIASHELKTPLTSIKGYSDIIIDAMEDRIDKGVYRMIQSINRAADRLHNVIENILDVTRIEQKKLRLRPEQFGLAAAARDCIDELAQMAKKRNIDFTCVFAESLPLFYGDRPRMQQVFTNLFTNAIKFSPDGSGIDVAISCEDHEHFHIIVKDRGIGIDKAEHKHIFDPFYEVGDIKKHSSDQIKFLGGGTGLGLSIAKGIVERHGGKIWVESEGLRKDEYPGSEFHVVLPVKSSISWDDFEQETMVPDGGEAERPLLTASSIEKKTPILLVDGDREAVEAVRTGLGNVFEIIVAPTGEFGLSLAFQYMPSLVLLDAQLPGIDAFRVCSILRSQEETREMPIIFLSGVTTREEIEKYFAAGADDFLIKPFSGRELMEKIWQILMKKKSEAEK